MQVQHGIDKVRPPTVEIVRQTPTVEIKGKPPRWKLFVKLFWLITTDESVRQNTTKRWRQTMTDEQMLQIAVDALVEIALDDHNLSKIAVAALAKIKLAKLENLK
jgi:hypothetical protein